MYSNRTGNEKVAVKLEGNFASTEAMDKKQGKPGRKIFRDHIVLRGKFFKKYKTCECLVFFGCLEETHPD